MYYHLYLEMDFLLHVFNTHELDLMFHFFFCPYFVSVRSSGMQWSFPNKVSALPQFLSFKTNQEDKPRKTILEPLASSGYMAMSTQYAFDSNQKSFLGLTNVCFFL